MSQKTTQVFFEMPVSNSTGFTYFLLVTLSSSESCSTASPLRASAWGRTCQRAGYIALPVSLLEDSSPLFWRYFSRYMQQYLFLPEMNEKLWSAVENCLKKPCRYCVLLVAGLRGSRVEEHVWYTGRAAGRGKWLCVASLWESAATGLCMVLVPDDVFSKSLFD